MGTGVYVVSYRDIHTKQTIYVIPFPSDFVDIDIRRRCHCGDIIPYNTFHDRRDDTAEGYHVGLYLLL